MDGATAPGTDASLDIPPRLFERLQQIAGYTWDDTKAFHSSYDNWHVFGVKHSSGTPHTNSTTNLQSVKTTTGRNATDGGVTPKAESENGSESDLYNESGEPGNLAVVARVSTHALREERAFHICRNLTRSVDPEGKHIVRPIDLVHFPNQQGGELNIVCIYEDPGPNDLPEFIDYGPAWYKGQKVGTQHEVIRDDDYIPKDQISLEAFLDFAVGATECLETLHHGQRIVHGEIRGDAFHMNLERKSVKLMNFGSGLRTFEHGLTSTGWSTLSKEIGAKTKLSYMSPEQTGRMPAEPDSRTDIYSLGILFWTLLTQQPAFDGNTPMDIIQSVLGRRLPSVSSIRMDVPDVIGKVIQKMCAKGISDRYHSAVGLRHDLVEIRRFLGGGNSTALKSFEIATKDVSSFFILPTIMIGRQAEHDAIVKIIDKVSRRHMMDQMQDVTSLSSGSSLSEGRLETLEAALAGMAAGDSSSGGDNTSSAEQTTSGLVNGGVSNDMKNPFRSASSQTRSIANSQNNSMESQDSNHSTRSNPVLKPWEKNSALSLEARSVIESISEGPRSSSDSVGSLTSQRNTSKFRRKGRCEVVSIAGAAGLGKSCLVQSVQVEARRRGYFASSKFDQAKQTPFGPVLKILSTLFKQVFSESNTDTPFHQLLKKYVRPAWPMLHKVLGLPEFLLSSNHSPQKRNHGSQASQAYNKSLHEFKRRESSPSSSGNSLYNNISLGTQSSQDFLRAGTSTKSMRLLNTFLDVLRVFTQHKFICLCLDDLRMRCSQTVNDLCSVINTDIGALTEFADEESLDLITQIISARMRIVMIVTYRPGEMLPARIKPILEPPNLEGIRYIKGNGIGITRVELQPLSEDDTTQYVAMALCRPAQEVVPLAAVIHSKTAGNPFYMREMLDTCHRKQCIWYDYRDSMWRFDIDRLFKQFETDNYHDTLNHEFVTSRLQELPSSTRSILAWAALLGTSFSFDMIQRLMIASSEFDYGQPDGQVDIPSSLTNPVDGIVEGLQAAIQAYVIVPTQDDDRFRFAHDRYVQAASSLVEYNGPEMHFIIAQTLLQYHSSDDRLREHIASHACDSIDVIRSRVTHRESFRKLLSDCAQLAAESGARPTAAKYYAACFSLLQADPWQDNEEDCNYDETLALYTRAAECYSYMGQCDEAKRLLSEVFAHARTPVDEAPSWVLQSRIHAQEGDSVTAFKALKRCLQALDIEVNENPSFEWCDKEFERLSLKIQSSDRQELMKKTMAKDSNLSAVGAVLVETISTAFWSDMLTYYQMSLVMVNTVLTHGTFPQSGMAFLHLATISISRFNMIRFGSELGNISLELMDRWRDPYTMGLGNTIYSIFVGHIQFSVATSIAQLEGALEYAIQAGDRISTILNFGMVSMLKFFASDQLADLESFCTYGCEEIIGWETDARGGTMLISIRQVSKALQGKTFTQDALHVMSDDVFDSNLYKSWLKTSQTNSDRPLLFYESIEMVPLFLYGHVEQAIEIGSSCLEKIDVVWAVRNARFIMLFQGLSLAARLWSKLNDPRRSLSVHTIGSATMGGDGTGQSKDEDLREERSKVLRQLRGFQRKIEDWQLVENINYFSWSKILAAQIAELEDDHGGAIRFYEESLDHASAHTFVFEEALGNYLLAGYFLRQRARRPAKAALREAVMLYRQFGAVGVAKHIENEHSLLLQGPTRNLRTADIAVQTDFAGDSAPVQYSTLEGDENDSRMRTIASMTETKGDRIGAWQGNAARADAGSGLPALDMLDLTSILESSQVISSVLQIDQLLKTMCEIILQNCGGLADLAAIVVEEDEPGWSIAASGDPDKGAEAHIPGIPLRETTLVAEGVIIYCTRFRETVFLPNLIHDERFSNVSEAWISQNPLGKSIIAIPICHGTKPLLGVLYLEGKPNVLTDRNLTVLQLLVNQIGISYSNALTMKAIEKVSATNISMVDLQKRALANAIEAEAKAKAAEVEALRSVQLAEEAAKAKSIFLANVSHELRTPLNGVIGNSELLKDSELRKDQAEMADSIRVSADLLLTVINDILDFSKMEADKMKLFIVAFNPSEMINEVIRSVSYSNRDKKSAKDVKIIQDIKLPDTLIFGDPVRLHQVLGNLIGNSLKFTEEGSITIGARTDHETEDSAQLTFWVKDTGIGIPPNKLAKLFKPFSQADASTARKYGGSGLGLSICRSLIETMMGGKIQLESVENVGTTAWFTVSFPKATPEALAGDTQNRPHEDTLQNDQNQSARDNLASYADFSRVPRDQLRICVAEDNPINQKIAVQFLQKLGFKYIDTYINGFEAVQGIKAKARDNPDTPYHICLMDVQMPVMDGYEATKELRKDEDEAVRNILVIAMTASAIQGDREKCLAAGMNDYLAKPVRSGVLKRKLDQYLNQPPLSLPNLQADAKNIAYEAMREVNGNPSPLSHGIPGTEISTPIRLRTEETVRQSAPLGQIDAVALDNNIETSSDEVSPASTPNVLIHPKTRKGTKNTSDDWPSQNSSGDLPSVDGIAEKENSDCGAIKRIKGKGKEK
ncbi:hypothetical protein BP5796_09000 [Coleophoma crateriformis]|uniref:histidine kinase n=1 Tax=Coleophoma crateriformis TaxID=565419 RepID=A0A3D8R2R8_9HELO|nr:hypothetical protein BP5796_09000 [Coleophoma crateriformis]